MIQWIQSSLMPAVLQFVCHAIRIPSLVFQCYFINAINITGLRVHEFVPHPGYYQIYLSEIPVGPDTSEDDANWITLADNIPDTTEDQVTTGIQAFDVTLPNITCDHCTIQVKQWASDFDWYYYTCTDIKIVADDSNIDTDDTCVGDESEWGETCSWSEVESLVRIMILQSIILGTVGLICFLILFGVILYTSECFGCRKDKCGSYVKSKKSNSGDIEMDDRNGGTSNMDDDIEENVGCCFKINRNLKRFWLLYTITWIFIIVAFVVTSIIIVEMKNCNVASDYGNDV